MSHTYIQDISFHLCEPSIYPSGLITYEFTTIAPKEHNGHQPRVHKIQDKIKEIRWWLGLKESNGITYLVMSIE